MSKVWTLLTIGIAFMTLAMIAAVNDGPVWTAIWMVCLIAECIVFPWFGAELAKTKR